MTTPVDSLLTAFIVAGEESGDILGADLMRALQRRAGAGVRFAGVGGERMTRAGLSSLFPMEELSLHGFSEVLARLPRLLARMRETVAAVLSSNPDVLILVDAPAFNLRLARRVRRQRPAIAIVDYVSPAVWAHNTWRARRMTSSVDEIMAILPFEPEVHRRLGGPRCVYVGHPLIGKLDVLRPKPGERPVLGHGTTATLLVLPGSRRSEIQRLMAPFGAAVALIAKQLGDVEVILPAVARVREEIGARLASWPVRPTVVLGEDGKLAAFRRAHAALAASGTVTLELALSGVPMAVAYRVEPLLRPLKPLMRAKSIVLANLALDDNVISEFVDGAATPERLAAAVVPLLGETPERAIQLRAFARLDALMRPEGGAPEDLAAREVLGTLARLKRPAQTVA